MFEQYTYEKLLADVLEAAPEGIDTRRAAFSLTRYREY
jgi:hypothetical protein